MIISRSIHVNAKAITSFLFMAERYFIVYICHFFFIHSSVHGHLDCFHVFSSVQFSRSVVSDSLRPHELQHARPPCPSPTPGVHSDSRPSSWRCHPAISSSVIPFSIFSNESTLRMRWPKYLPLVNSTALNIVVILSFSHVQLCDPMNCNTPGSPVLHCLPEFAQIHAH